NPIRILGSAAGFEQSRQPAIAGTQPCPILRILCLGDEFFMDRHGLSVSLLRFLRAFGLLQQRPEEYVIGETKFLLVERRTRKITDQFLKNSLSLAIGFLCFRMAVGGSQPHCLAAKASVRAEMTRVPNA